MKFAFALTCLFVGTFVDAFKILQMFSCSIFETDFNHTVYKKSYVNHSMCIYQPLSCSVSLL